MSTDRRQCCIAGCEAEGTHSDTLRPTVGGLDLRPFKATLCEDHYWWLLGSG